MRQGQRFLRAELPRILAMPPGVLSPRMVRMIEDLAGDWRRLDERVESLSNEIEAARQDTGCERLMSVPGIGPIISSAMVAAIGAGDVFTKGRDFAAWLGTRAKADLEGLFSTQYAVTNLASHDPAEVFAFWFPKHVRWETETLRLPIARAHLLPVRLATHKYDIW